MTGRCVVRGCREPVADDSDVYCEECRREMSSENHAANIASHLFGSNGGDD